MPHTTEWDSFHSQGHVGSVTFPGDDQTIPFWGDRNVNIFVPVTFRTSRTIRVIDLATFHPEPFPASDRLTLLGHDAERWGTEGVGSRQLPAIHDDMIIAGQVDGTLSARSITTGEPCWSQKIGSPIGTPVVYDDVVYVCGEGCLHAVDADSGIITWSARSTAAGFTTPILQDDVLYIAGRDGTILAIEPATGDLYWQTPLVDPVDAPPVLAEDLVIVRSVMGAITALDIVTGEVCWHVHAGWRFDTAHMCVVGNTLVTSGPGSSILGFDIRDGHHCWQIDIDGMSGGSIAAYDDHVIVETTLPDRSSAVASLCAETGHPAWSRIIPAGISTEIQVSGSMVIVGDHDGQAHALAARTGTVLWRLVIDDDTSIESLAMSGSTLVAITTSRAELVCRLPAFQLDRSER